MLKFSITWSPLFAGGQIVGDGGTNQILQGRRVNTIAFTEVDGSGVLGIEAGVEHTLRIFQRCAVEEIELHMILEGTGAANKPVARPHPGIPLPFLGDIGVGLEDHFAQSGKHFAAPVAQLCYLMGDELRGLQADS